MKKIFIKTGLLFGIAALVFSCSDFEELNIDPQAANEEQVQVEYFINNSIIGAQMNPHIAERVFVLYWKAAGRQARINTLPVGSYSDGWSNDYFNYNAGWLNHINTAIQIANQKIESGNEEEYTYNLLNVARIWRAYLMSELADNFGPIPINAFQGENPEFASVKEVYYYLLAELDEAVLALDPSVVNPSGLANLDPAYGYDYAKWRRFGNSLRMRLAMRLSEVDPAKAQEEFEAVANSNLLITTMDEAFKVKEQPGWNDLTGVMSREWNAQFISATLNNLYIGLGGVKTADQLPSSYHQYIKPENWMGLKYENHFTTMTNDPSAGYWFNGLHEEIDPRAYEAFAIPGDFDNPSFSFYPSYTDDARTTVRTLTNEDAETVEEIDAAFTWNASAYGDWGEKGAKNNLYNYIGTIPRMVQDFRSSTAERIFFGPWETYFLLAEGALRGWQTPIDAQTAYESGIASSFEYWGVSEHLSEYLTSEEYNRVGTSVSWNHTIEPPETFTMEFKNGYTGEEGTVEISYPDNDLYKNGTIKNDHLTKIITQKFIAQFPWLPLEAWSDQRRLGLPFFENPAVENPLPDMPALNSSNYMTVQIDFFPQRLKYPSGLRNSDPEGYQQALEYLGGPDGIFTPLWWAQQE
ncbi:MAG TPA: SusD/RagB family nutrient-binding outer membrane lipoprotein [Salinimicrobium sp.]|nr:SusD/RagB family nutrient-binding outer membrane lipoprotein [Salinimicrobium sp.]